MAVVIIPGRSSAPPRWPMTLNTGHPLAESLAVFVPLTRPGVYRDLVSNKGPSGGTYPSNQIPQVNTRYAGRIGAGIVGTRFTSASSEYLTFAVPVSQQYGWSLATSNVRGVIGNATFACVLGLITGSDQSAVAWGKASGGAIWRAFQSNGTSSDAQCSELLTNENQRLLGTVTSATLRTAYEDVRAPVTNTVSRVITAPTHVTIGARWSGTVFGQFLNTPLEYVVAWHRVLGDAEARAFNLNPWQLVARDRRRVYAIPDVGGGITLTVADALHGHLADNLALSQANTLTTADALHGHTADNLTLTQANTLAAQDATHGHTADNLTLTQAHLLAVADALHGHLADNLTLSSATNLTVADALHSHTVDNVALVQANVLAVADALHGHTADNVLLTQAHVLVVQDALHGHTVDNVVLSLSTALVIADALHAHAADNVTLTQAHVLGVADATHAHTVDNVALTQANVLIVSDALHAHLADSLNLRLPGMLGRHTLFIVAAADRVVVVSRADRYFTVH